MDDNILFRVDYRLMHGQVVTGWIKALNAKRIVIIDDETKGNKFLQGVFNMAKPEGVKLKFYSVDEAPMAWEEDRFKIKEGRSAIVLAKDPAAALKLVSEGLPIKRLQIGTVEGGAGKKNIENIYYLDESDAATIQAIANEGVEVFFQSSTSTSAVPWEQIRSKHFPEIM